MLATKEIHLINREAKWQFRRLLMLEVARKLEGDPEATWTKISATLASLSASASPSTRRNARRWIRFAGNTPSKTIGVIQRHFSADTPDGIRRQKLQDLSDGHPFAGVVSDKIVARIRKVAATGAFAEES